MRIYRPDDASGFSSAGVPRYLEEGTLKSEATGSANEWDASSEDQRQQKMEGTIHYLLMGGGHPAVLLESVWRPAGEGVSFEREESYRHAAKNAGCAIVAVRRLGEGGYMHYLFLTPDTGITAEQCMATLQNQSTAPERAHRVPPL